MSLMPIFKSQNLANKALENYSFQIVCSQKEFQFASSQFQTILHDLILFIFLLIVKDKNNQNFSDIRSTKSVIVLQPLKLLECLVSHSKVLHNDPLFPV